MARYRILWASLALMACMGEVDPETALPVAPATETAAGLSSLRVMTYNVKGLPWPVALGRDLPIAAIGDRLAAMRRRGEQPHVLVLQEAFVDGAKQIGVRSGYRHVAFGPGAEQAAALTEHPIGPAFGRQASWLKGETVAPVLDSGLALFSDFPIERIERWSFPQGACAGYDCLAAKGMLIAWIRLPGHAEPVAVATTHLNSLHSSGVPLPRANAAFAWQFARIRAFTASRIGAGEAAILAGDFNLGADLERISAARRIGPPLPRAREAVADALARKTVPRARLAEAEAVSRKGTDQLFYRSGRALALDAVALDIPFPETADEPLSDHPGLLVRYALSEAS